MGVQKWVPSRRDRAHVGAGRHMLERLWTTALLLALVGLLPLAHASPVDPSWLGGIYDAADFDDVAQTITALDGSVEVAPLTNFLTSDLPVVDLTRPPTPPNPLVCCVQPRAPPAHLQDPTDTH